MKRLGRAASVLVAIAFAACFSKPDDPDHLRQDAMRTDSNGTDGAADGLPDSPPLPGCTTSTVHDAFDPNASVCGAWGVPTNAMLTRVAGVLDVNPVNPGSDAYCSSISFSFANGTSIEIPQTLDGTGSTFFRVEGGSASTEIRIAGGQVTISCVNNGSSNNSTSFSYDGMTQVWWKLVPVSSNLVEAHASIDGNNWGTAVGNCVWSNTTTQVDAVMGGGITYGGTTSRTTHFDNFNEKTCPP